MIPGIERSRRNSIINYVVSGAAPSSPDTCYAMMVLVNMLMDVL